MHHTPIPASQACKTGDVTPMPQMRKHAQEVTQELNCSLIESSPTSSCLKLPASPLKAPWHPAHTLLSECLRSSADRC